MLYFHMCVEKKKKKKKKKKKEECCCDAIFHDFGVNALTRVNITL